MAAGRGTRMRSSRPKHLHELLGKRLVDWVVDAVRPLGPDRLVVVTSADAEDELRESLPDGVATAVQPEPRGTGDAALVGLQALGDFAGDLLVLSGDTPLLDADLLRALLAAHRAERAAVTVLSFEPADARAYGRVVRAADGSVRAIVEAADASPEELSIVEANSSIYAFDAAALAPALARLDTANAQGELYLTDAVRRLVADGARAAAFRAPDPLAAEGVNTRAELAEAAAQLRARVNRAHMLAGVAIVDPETTWIDAGVELEPDAVVHPFTVLRGRTVVRSGAEIGPHAVAVDALVGAGALVGPFCYLRPGTVLDEGAKAGTFVEIKNSHLGKGAKVPHQSYIGDAEIGEGTNVGAGAITANFPHRPGQPKGRTTIGRDVRTGVHNSFVAPVTIGDGAWVAAGSTVTEDVPPGALAIARARQVNREDYVDAERDE